MTLCELSERYKIELDKLQYFADNHLIEGKQEYGSKEEKRLGILCTLYEIGLRAAAMKQFLLYDKEHNRTEQLKLLNMRRADLMEDIHGRQKSLDQIDYMIYEIKKEIGVNEK